MRKLVEEFKIVSSSVEVFYNSMYLSLESTASIFHDYISTSEAYKTSAINGGSKNTVAAPKQNTSAPANKAASRNLRKFRKLDDYNTDKEDPFFIRSYWHPENTC